MHPRTGWSGAIPSMQEQGPHRSLRAASLVWTVLVVLLLASVLAVPWVAGAESLPAPPPAEVLVRVMNVKGQRVEGARIEVRSSHPMDEDVLEVLTTGADGEARLRNVDASGLRFTVQAPGTCGEERNVRSPEPGALQVRVVHLRPGATLQGRVVDARGQPIPNARVEARPWYRKTLRRTGTSDAKGRFSLPDLCAGPLGVQASAPSRFADVELPHVTAPDKALVLTLPDLAGLTVRARDEQGRPVSRAFIRLEPKPPLAYERYEKVSGDLGQVDFSRFPPGPYQVEAEWVHPRGEPLKQALAVELKPGQVHTAEFRFVPPPLPSRSLTGRVIDPEGRPVSGANVFASPDTRTEVDEETGTALVPEKVGNALTGRDGRFSLARLPEGPLDLRVTEARFHPSKNHKVPAGTKEVTLVMERYQLAFTGRVVRADGTPISRFSIGDTDFDSKDGRFTYTAREGADGPEALSLRAPGLTSALLDPEVPRGNEPKSLGDIVLYRLRTVRGRVVREDGHTPVAHAEVSLEEGDFARGQRLHRRDLVRTDEAGRFVLEKVRDVAQSLVARDTPHGVALRPLAVSEDEVTVRLHRGAEVTGTVTDARGRPFPEAHVVARCDLPAGVQTVTADAQGRYRLRGLGPHACTLQPFVERNTLADPTTPPAFMPKVVVLPASGNVRVDLAERSGPASLRVLKDPSVLDVYLLEGDVEAPSTSRALDALEPRSLSQGLSFENEDDALAVEPVSRRKPPLDFHRLPLGR